MTMIDTYNRLRKTSWSGIWGKRLLSELQYILELSRAEEGKRKHNKRNMRDTGKESDMHGRRCEGTDGSSDRTCTYRHELDVGLQ